MKLGGCPHGPRLMRVLALLWVTLGPVQAAFLRPKGQAAKGQLSTLAEPRDESGVRKPKMDKRRYEHRMLRSGLRVLLVEDPEAQKSSYAMAVEVGSLEDPKDFQGLAHFCEHMVFLGSKKYPKEDEFSDKLAFYGGTNNAYTASDQTVYFAEVDDKGFDETFDIFAQFFIEPSFAPKMVDKEVNAVDSEHKKNMADTTWRLIHLLKSRANPKSPVSKFSTGTLETLKLEPEKAGKSLPEALQKFHQENYCSSRMHLVIMRNASIEQQLAAAERSFGSLSSKGCEARPYYDDIPMFRHELDNLGRKFKVHTDGSPQLWLTFPMMSLQGQYKTMPEAYINYALSHYGPGSLKALLKREDLALHYSTMLETTLAGSVLTLIFSLTPKGAEESDRIVEHTFAYFNTIKKNGVDKALIQTLWQEAKLFENFAHWDPGTLLDDVHQKVLPLSGEGTWCLGAGTEVPPRLMRVVRSTQQIQGKSCIPLGHWCLCLSNEDPLTDYAPSGLVCTLRGPCRPRLVAYRCKASAFRPHRAGAVLALAHGLGNDKGPERPAVLMSFVRDGNSREILGAKSWSSEPLAAWRDGEWLTLILKLDWEKRAVEIRVEGEDQLVQKQMPFANPECDAVKYLLLYNHTGDFIAYWTDLLIL